METTADRVDEALLTELFDVLGDDSDALRGAYGLFLTGVAARLAEIDAALAAGCFEDAARAAHTLRGSAGSFGARRLSALTTAVEERCREHDADGVLALVEEMRAEFEAFRAILAERLAGLGCSSGS